jgi:hypothetical protein
MKLLFIKIILLSNLGVQQPKPPKKPVTDTTKKLWYWKGTYISKNQYLDSIGVVYLRFCDSLKKSKTVN